MLFRGPFQACDSDPCYSNGSLASDISRSDVLPATNRMPSSFGGQPNLFKLPKQNSPLAILDSSAGVTPCPSCDLWAPWVSTQALKPCLLKGFPTSAEPREKPGSWMCIHWGHPLHPRPQPAGTRGHPRRGHREAPDTEAPPQSEPGGTRCWGPARPLCEWRKAAGSSLGLGTPNPPGDGQGDFLSWRMGRAGLACSLLRSGASLLISDPADGNRTRKGRWVRCGAEESGEEKSAEKVPLRAAIHVTDKVINSFC